MSLCRGCHYIEENEKLKKELRKSGWFSTDKIAYCMLAIWVAFCGGGVVLLFRVGWNLWTS